MEVPDDVYVRSVPVSSSMRLMRYSRIMPCLSRSGGGSHERKILVELTAYPFGSCGALVGTEEEALSEENSSSNSILVTVYVIVHEGY